MADATNSDGRPLDTVEVYQLLRRGLGHEHVDDDNVAALIEIAEREGHALLAQELREWRAPCRPDSGGAPEAIAPIRSPDTPGNDSPAR